LISLLIICTALLGWGREAQGYSVEVSKIYTLEDGVNVTVHYRPAELGRYHINGDRYAAKIMRYAVNAYKKIVYKQGFDTSGFTYANPDKAYCHDSDRTIDIIISESSDAPYFDVIKGEGTDYDAIIQFPADYSGYLEKWGLKADDKQAVSLRMRASLYHEMLHVITYSYNKNIEPWYEKDSSSLSYQGGDWYVEGLARYFETFADSYVNFFSEGFLETEEGKVKVSQNGANYLMKHPSEPLREARYDYSLFWAYVHKRYGMERIEEISRRLRFVSRGDIKNQLPEIISSVLKEDFKNVMGSFAVAMYFKYFNPDIKKHLNDLKVMSLEDVSSGGGKSIGSWSSNFITLDLSDINMPDKIAVKKDMQSGELRMNIFARVKDGRIAELEGITLDKTDTLCAMNLAAMKSIGVKELILIITNADSEENMIYRVLKS